MHYCDRDVAFEVATFHQNRVIHGNINPRNIFIFKGRRLFAKLLDDGKYPSRQLQKFDL